MRNIEILNKTFTYSYSFDYEFAVIQGNKKDLDFLARELDSYFFKYEIIKQPHGPHMRLYYSVLDIVKFFRNIGA